MNISNIKPTAKFAVFYDDCYYQSTGYEREDEIGSRMEYINTRFFDDASQVEAWLLTQSTTLKYKVVSIEHLTVKKTVSFDITK